MMVLNFILAVMIAAAVVSAVLWIFKRPGWMGFSGKTLWDWLTILSVPVLIGFSAMYFNFSQRALEQLRQEELSFQMYVEQMSKLVLEPNKTPEHFALAQAQTTAILHLVRQNRATRALKFLDDFDLLTTLSIDLVDLDLSSAELKGLRLEGVDFEGSNLRKADMEDGHFARADFESVDLGKSDLKGADFRGATFENANLAGADLGWADFRGADLRHALGLSSRKISKACIDETTMLPLGFEPALKASKVCFQVKDD